MQQVGIGGVKVYQDDKLLRPQGFPKTKYQVETDDGQMEIFKLKKGLSFSYSVSFRGKITRLEENLSTLEYILSVIPLIFLVFSGGAIGFVIGIITLNFNCNYIRREKRLYLQIIVCLSSALIAWLIYLLIALAINRMIYG